LSLLRDYRETSAKWLHDSTAQPATASDPRTMRCGQCRDDEWGVRAAFRIFHGGTSCPMLDLLHRIAAHPHTSTTAACSMRAMCAAAIRRSSNQATAPPTVAPTIDLKVGAQMTVD
jgi:hypothetical protein